MKTPYNYVKRLIGIEERSDIIAQTLSAFPDRDQAKLRREIYSLLWRLGSKSAGLGAAKACKSLFPEPQQYRDNDWVKASDGYVFSARYLKLIDKALAGGVK